MKKVDVVTVGSAVKDIMFYTDEVSIIKNKKDLRRQVLLAAEYGAKIEINDVHVNYGGGAVNVAVGLNNFGLKVAPLINVGRDFAGREFYSFLKKQKIRTDLITVDKKKPTGFSFIVSAPKDCEHTIFTYKSASEDLNLPAKIEKIKTAWFYIAPLSSRFWESIVARIVIRKRFLERLNSKKKKPYGIVWNPGGKQLAQASRIKKFFPFIDVMILNKDEAVGLALDLSGKNIDRKKINQTKYLLDRIKSFGIKNVIITAGAKGAYGRDENNRYHYHSSLARRISDTVGAGDSFGAGFLAGMIFYNDFKRALLLGIKNSAANLAEIGAQRGMLKLKLK